MGHTRHTSAAWTNTSVSNFYSRHLYAKRCVDAKRPHLFHRRLLLSIMLPVEAGVEEGVTAAAVGRGSIVLSLTNRTIAMIMVLQGMITVPLPGMITDD